MKKQVHDFLLGRFMDVRNIHTDYKAKMREMLKGPDSYREWHVDGDTSCMAMWPSSATKTSDLVVVTLIHA